MSAQPSDSMQSLHFCIFSFNRGLYLKNCVDSIRLCAPDCPISIYDDGSTDPHTLKVLQSLQTSCSIEQCGDTLKNKHGGLSANMQRALGQFDDNQWVCLLQDDMQMIRHLGDDDLRSIAKFFAASGRHAFLHPAMLKGVRRAIDRRNTTFDQQAGAYFRSDRGASAGVCFADVSIVHVARLREKGWSFEGRESDREDRAEHLFGKMGFMRDPFIMWLPSVPAWRGKTRTRALALAEKRQRCGFYPFEILTRVGIDSLKGRDQAILPVAEDFLSLRESGVGGRGLQQPWKYHPLQNQRVLKWLNQIELYFHRS